MPARFSAKDRAPRDFQRFQTIESGDGVDAILSCRGSNWAHWTLPGSQSWFSIRHVHRDTLWRSGFQATHRYQFDICLCIPGSDPSTDLSRLERCTLRSLTRCIHIRIQLITRSRRGSVVPVTLKLLIYDQQLCEMRFQLITHSDRRVRSNCVSGCEMDIDQRHTCALSCWPVCWDACSFTRDWRANCTNDRIESPWQLVSEHTHCCFGWPYTHARVINAR